MKTHGLKGEENIPLLVEESIENSALQCPNDQLSKKKHSKCCKCAIFSNRIDGGYSWLITIVSFIVQFYILGFMNNISSLNSLWVKHFSMTPGMISWVGSINIGMMFLSAPTAALLEKKIGCQATGIIGCIFSVIGLMMASFSTTFINLLLWYGLIFGFGSSCCFFSSILVQAKYFDKRLALSNGFVTAGSGAGTLLFSAFSHSFYTQFGWRSGIRYYSIGYLFLILLKTLYNDLVVSIRICRPDRNDTRRNKINIDPIIWMRTTVSDLCPLRLLKNIPFLFFNISCVFFMMGYFVPYIHLVFYAENKGIDHENANFLIGYMAMASLCGKLITGKIAEIPCVSPLLLMTGSFVGIGLSHIAATMASTYIHFISYSVVFGFFDGAYACLVTVVVCDIIGKSELGSGIGLLYGIKSIPLICGGPFAGFLYDYSHSYFLPFLVSGIIVFFSAYLMLIIPFYDLYHRKNLYKYITAKFTDNIDSLYLNSEKNFENSTLEHNNNHFNHNDKSGPMINHSPKANSYSENSIADSKNSTNDLNNKINCYSSKNNIEFKNTFLSTNSDYFQRNDPNGDYSYS